METVKELSIRKSKSFYQKLVFKLLGRFDRGRLDITMPDGSLYTFGEKDHGGLRAEITIKNMNFFKKCVRYGDVGFGESFVDGDWVTSNLTNVIRWAVKNYENSGVISGSKTKTYLINLLEFFNKVENKFNRNSIDGSKKNISYHYDISNDFYQLMLDPTMSYSCAFFTKKEQNLHTAQLNKLELVCNDLNLDESVHCLEIGCGWGGLAVYAVEKYNCRWTGVTISKEQYDFATRLVKEKGLEDKITILLKDYRHIEGQYDRIVSIEMIEAVGDEFLPQYFAKIDSLLKPEGAAVIQAITSPDSRYESFKKGVDFIQKHIFPGTLLPSINAMVSACQKDTQLHLYNLRDIGVHYARTLKVWREKVFDQIEDISKLGLDETFIRKWDYYLSYCEAAFAERHISDVQIVLVKPNNTRFQYSKDLFDY